MERFSWNMDQVAIMLGIQYIGWMDDFAVFRDALTDAEIQQLMALPNGVSTVSR